MSYITQILQEDCKNRKIVARSAKSMGNHAHRGSVIFPMDMIDRRKDSRYRSSRVVKYYLPKEALY